MFWRDTLYLLYLLVAGTICSAADDFILPTDVVPRHYDLKLLFDIDPTTHFSFYGVVNILVTAKKSTSKIVLNAEGYNVSEEKISLTPVSGNLPVGISSAILTNSYSFLTISLENALEENKNYSLIIPFHGKLKEGLNGAYISHYLDKLSRKKQYLIITHFEPTYARKAFPCFDEPLYKATFTIRIGHRKDFSAISNMPVAAVTTDYALEPYWPWSEVKKTFNSDMSSFVWTAFERSVPMSTYLVAFLVSDYTYMESPPGLSSTKIRIWAKKDAIQQAMYASTIGPKILSYYENWFHISFPLPKLDMAAVPDLALGGMENWGLIFYKEALLLFDKQESNYISKENICKMIAHELAHQWFGNLVTMKWWSDLWLKEGFAEFLQSTGVNAVAPNWNAMTYDAMEQLWSVLDSDALESSHPVSVHIHDLNMIKEIFDDISYKKGSLIIRMMKMFLGEDVFKKAINKYLLKYSYSNAEKDDLWHELTVVMQQYGSLSRNVTVKEIMDTWTTQAGYPILTVTRDYTSGTVTVLQKKYLSQDIKARTSSSWWVPLNVQCEKDLVTESHQPMRWLAANEGVDNEYRFSHGAKANEWLLFNKEYIALSRINYDERNWQLLLKVMNSPNMNDVSMLSRVQLIFDSFALAWTNRLDYSIPLQLSTYLKRETEYLPLKVSLTELKKIETVLIRTLHYGDFQKFVRKLITDIYKESGGLAVKRIINENDINSVRIQVILSEWACRMKVPGCEDNAIDMFQQWMNTENPDENNPIPLDLRPTVYCVAIERGGEPYWRFLVTRLRRTNVAATRFLIQKALCCTSEVWILSEYLEWVVSNTSDLRAQDSPMVLMHMVGSSVGYYVVKDFIYNRIEEIGEKIFGQMLSRILKDFGNCLSTQRELDEFLAWRDKNTKYLEAYTLGINQAIDRAAVNVRWFTRNGRSVSNKMRELSADFKEAKPLRTLRNKAEGMHNFSQIYSVLIILLNAQFYM